MTSKAETMQNADENVLFVSSPKAMIEAIGKLERTKPVCSVIVEGGAQTLQSFIDENLFDEIRVETAPFSIHKGIAAPQLPQNIEVVKREFYGNSIVTYKRL